MNRRRKVSVQQYVESREENLSATGEAQDDAGVLNKPVQNNGEPSNSESSDIGRLLELSTSPNQNPDNSDNLARIADTVLTGPMQKKAFSRYLHSDTPDITTDTPSLSPGHLDFLTNGILILSLIGGFVAMTTEFVLPWSPTGLVVAYGACLFFLVKKNVKLLEQKADTVYFLGFLFTLLSLYFVGAKISNGTDITFDIFRGVAFLGTAVFTTVAGVILRNMILDYAINRLNTIEETDYSSYLRDIATAHAEFRKLHESSVDLMRQFIENRMESLKTETRLSNEFLEGLTRLAERSNQLVKEDLPQLQKAVAESVALTSGFCRDFVRATEEPLSEFRRNAETISGDLSRIFSAAMDQIGQRCTDETSSLLRRLNEIISEKIRDLDTLGKKTVEEYHSKYGEIHRNLVEGFESLQKTVVSAERSIASLDTHAGDTGNAIERLSRLVGNLDSAVDNLSTILDGYSEAIGQKAKKVVDTFR